MTQDIKSLHVVLPIPTILGDIVLKSDFDNMFSALLALCYWEFEDKDQLSPQKVTQIGKLWNIERRVCTGEKYSSSNVKKTLIGTYFWQKNCLTYSFLAGQPVPSSQGSKPRGVDPGDKVGKRSVNEIANMVYTVVHRLLTYYKKIPCMMCIINWLL